MGNLDNQARIWMALPLMEDFEHLLFLIACGFLIHLPFPN